MTKPADQYVTVHVDRSHGYHVVHIVVHYSDSAVVHGTDYPGMAWNYVGIRYRAQSDLRPDAATCYGFDEPELSGDLRNVKRTLPCAEALQRKLAKVAQESGPVRTPGDLVRRIVASAGRKVPVWFEGSIRPVASVASSVDDSTAKFHKAGATTA